MRHVEQNPRFAVLVTRSAALAVLLLAAFGAAPARAESLLDALADAYYYSPALDAQRATLRATDEDVAIANSNYRPNINGQADVGVQQQTVRPSFGTGGTTVPRGYAIQLVQPVFRGFRTINAVNGAEATVRAGREQLRTVEQQALLDAVTAYADVVRDEAILKLQQASSDFLKTQLQATRDRFKVGELTKTDVAQSEARNEDGLSQVQIALANLKASRAAYERAVGHPPGSLRAPNQNIPLVPRSLREAIDIGNQENPNVVAALYLEQAAKFQVDEIRGELLPELQLEATYSERFESSTQIDEVETGSVVGRLNMPIYPSGGAVYARVRQAKQTHLSRIQQIEQNRSLTQAQVVASWSQLQGRKAQQESNQAAIDSNRTALAGVQEEEKVGQRTIDDVLNFQRDLINSQVTLEQTKRDIIVSAFTLVSNVGRLNIAELGAVRSAYDPEVHYGEVRRKAWGIDITRDDEDRSRDPWGTRVEHAPVK